MRHALLGTVANRLGYEDTPVERGKGPKKRHIKFCPRCAVKDHSAFHDPILGCMEPVDRAPRDFLCLCGLTPHKNTSED